MTGQVNVKQLISRTPYNIWRHRPKAFQCRNNWETTMTTYYTRYGNPEKRRHTI